jgi:hypothetical protein
MRDDEADGHPKNLPTTKQAEADERRPLEPLELEI